MCIEGKKFPLRHDFKKSFIQDALIFITNNDPLIIKWTSFPYSSQEAPKLFPFPDYFRNDICASFTL